LYFFNNTKGENKMDSHVYTDQELRFTAMLYATRADVVKTLRETGKLPAKISLGGFPVAMNVLERSRGRDINLSENEQLVYDAIVRERRLPGGGVLFFTGCRPIFSMEKEENINRWAQE
jgi:hypothetical protein